MKIFPIDHLSNQIIGIFKKHKAFIIIGDTGSGKTTRIPHFSYFIQNQKNKIICCSQPRRIGAISVAKRISNEMNYKLGSKIGYHIRFENLTTKKTRIKFITDGLLVKEFLINPFLENYTVLILDEIHERTANTDLILVLCRNLLEIRSDIQLVITSATLEVEKYSRFFFNCPIFSIPGRCFLIKIYFKNFSLNDSLSSSFNSIIKILENSFKGDILVFLTGKEEINIIGNLLFFLRKKTPNYWKFIILPIFSGLSLQIQTYILKTFNFKRKIILSTNITETSITIPGISYVIDSGLVKQKIFNPYSTIFNLTITPICQNSAIQRTGRAGRNRVGKCFRIYSKWSYYNEMIKNSFPEIQKIDISRIILFLKGLGLKNFLTFEWLDIPSKIFFFQGLKLLYSIGALSKKGNITMDGRKMLELPIAPILAKVLLKSNRYNSLNEILIISSMEINSLSLRNFFTVKNFIKIKPFLKSDHIFLLNLFLTWKFSSYSSNWCKKCGIDFSSMQLSKNVLEQLKNILKPKSNKVIRFPSLEGIIRSFLIGYFYNLAKIKTNRIYQLIFVIKEFYAQLHPFSILNFLKFYPNLILFNDIILIKKPYLKMVTEIKKKFLKDLINEI
jgi:HrpA-like RNA helicase